MTDKQIIKMLKELVNEIDYDIYKTYFVYPPGSGDDQDPKRLLKIVKSHLKKNTK